MTEDYPMGETGPDDRIYTAIVGVRNHHRKEPSQMAERKLRVKMRDGFRCVYCGLSWVNLQVHHKKGTKSHRMKDLETVCLSCHQEVTQASKT